jgi:signal transduction histidine kinase
MAEILQVRSLQRKVAVITSAAVAVALLLGISGARMAEELEQHQHLDMHLEEVAQTLLALAAEDAHNTAALLHRATPHVFPLNPANADLRFQVWLRDGAVLLQTNDAESTRPLMPLEQQGFASATVQGKPGRVYALASPDKAFAVQVAEQFEDRDGDTATLLRYYFLPIALPLLLSMFASWVLLRRSATALDNFADRLRHLDLLNMGPVFIDKPTHEILPVIDEVNALFQRANNALVTEQRFTSMAAHELRTPWAGIKAQAQLALKARSPQDLQESLQSIITCVNRASHVFDQLFDLTRLESSGEEIASKFQPVPVASVYQQVMGDLDSKAVAKRIAVYTRWGQAMLFGLDFALFLLLRNLISNAILYGNEGGRIDISTECVDDKTILCVDDSGKGIPVEAREMAFERFNRLDQHGSDGVGLGLSIVRKVVELHNGTIELLDSPLGGLRVRVTLPASPNH